MQIKTFIDTDIHGQCWSLIQFGPVEDEREAQAMLETMRELFSQRFGVPITPPDRRH